MNQRPASIFFILLSLLCIFSSSYSQSGYSVHQYTTDNGLPANGIKGMLFDSTTGFLWLATEGGLSRFNGIEFQTYTKSKNKHPLSDRMTLLFQNWNGHIYAVDHLRRLYEIQRQTPFFIDSSLASPHLFASAYLLYVSKKMFDNRKTTTQQLFINPQLGYDKILPLSDTAGLAIHIEDNRPYYFSLSNPNPRLLELPVKSITDFFVIGKRCFIADTNRNIYELDPSDLHLTKMQAGFTALPSDLIFWQKNSSDPIYISGLTAFTLRLENQVLHRDTLCNALPKEVNFRIVQYHRAIRTLFISTETNGMFILRENTLEPVKKIKKDNAQILSFYSQLVLPNGNILTNDGQQLGKSPITLDIPIKGSFGQFVHTDGDSVIWYSKEVTPTPGKQAILLHSYNSLTKKTTVFTKFTLNYRSPLHTSMGSLYVLTTAGLYKLQTDTLIEVDNRFHQDSVGTAFHLKEISPGVLGIVTRDYVFLYDTYTGKTKTILVNKSVDIRTIWSYENYVFIGTYGAGIYVYHNGKTKALPPDKNMYLLFANCFTQDEYGYCWISTNKGLFKARISDMIQAFESNHTAATTVYYHYYGKADGMDITEMNGGCIPCAVERQDKTLSFPTVSGLLWVKPSVAKPGLPWNSFHIDEFRANQQSINPDSIQYTKLPSNTKVIRLKIAYPAWENHENIYLQYQLDYDSTWKWPETGNSIVLANPGYGNHVLKIRKFNGFDPQNITVSNIRFSIARPVYTTWWFYILTGLCGVGCIYLYMRLRTRLYMIRQYKLEQLIDEKTKELKARNIDLEKRDTIKTRLISIINHDIITPLKFLAVTGKNLMEKRKVMSEKIQDETIYEMVLAAKELHDLSTNILNWIKYQSEGKGLIKERFFLHEMIDKILNVLTPVASLKQLQLNNSISPALEVYQYYDPLKVLIYNLVSNSIKFMQKGTIHIDAAMIDKELTIRVSDEGIGMTETQVQNLLIGKTHIHSGKNNPGAGHGLGYQIIRDLLNITGATIAIESEVSKGTTVFIRFVNELPQYAAPTEPADDTYLQNDYPNQ